ncbi:hypothetical protein FA95DRAFT_1564719 [Auriscalpium vulgare]|uniref:Uncharacterized protein n=1 Tax=Auriscalpium vulgare TaxID=40419 RepID=A0ACB8RDK5_9AGAM|nr:hypothetical protein FA95DRAFT_1564719 [Auriscalpium vulgare]
MAAEDNPPPNHLPIDQSLPVARTSSVYPEFGAFAVFTLDPVASLEALEDPVALDAARALAPSCKKYIGFVVGVLDLPSEDRKYHKCDIYILSRGLAIPSPTRHIDENMCTPVAPATHPQGRPAVAPIPALPLPWDDLYIHYNAFFALRVKTDRHETDLSSSPMFSFTELFAVEEYLSEDGQRQNALFQEEWLRSRQTGDIDESVADDAADHPSRVEDDQATELEEEDQATQSEYSDDGLDIAEVFYEALGNDGHPRDQFMPVVSYDFDLAAVTEFAGARELYEETLEMRRIRAESEQRTSAALQRLDEEREAREREAGEREARERLQEESMASSRSLTCAPPSSPVLSSVTATLQPHLPQQSSSIREKTRVLRRTVFSCIYQNHFDEAEEKKEPQELPGCLPIPALIRARVKGIRRAVRQFASGLLPTFRRAHAHSKRDTPPQTMGGTHPR